MAAVTLTENDIALFSDPEGTRVVIPHLTGKGPQLQAASRLEHFDGFDFPVEYRGEARSDQVTVECRWTPAQHEDLVAFLDLWETSTTAADSRFQLRTRIGSVAGLNPLEVVSIPQLSHPFQAAGFVTVSFTAYRVYHTLEV